MRSIPKKSRSKLVLLLAAVTLAGGNFFLLKYGNSRPIPVPVYTALRVIDGDTFETTEKQLIRLASIEAPELSLCGGSDAKKALEKLIMDKPLYIKVHYRDPYNRLVSQVYNEKIYINRYMVEHGYAYYYNREKAIAPDLKTASDIARSRKIGLFGKTCTQTVNNERPSCNIKGNVREQKTYFTSKCQQYQITQVQLYLGDRWFCTEKEAEKAGFRKGKQCP